MLITKKTEVGITRDLLREIIENLLRYQAPEHARQAMETYGRDTIFTTPMQIFDTLQVISLAEIMEGPIYITNDLRSGIGEGFTELENDRLDYIKERGPEEWASIIGLIIDSPSFTDALLRWIKEQE